MQAESTVCHELSQFIEMKRRLCAIFNENKHLATLNFRSAKRISLSSVQFNWKFSSSHVKSSGWDFTFSEKVNIWTGTYSVISDLSSLLCLSISDTSESARFLAAVQFASIALSRIADGEDNWLFLMQHRISLNSFRKLSLSHP